MACKESICRNCFHSYVCEQFNENKDDNNEKCHFANDHYIPRADVVPKSEIALDVIRKVKNKVRKYKHNVVNPYEHIILYLNELEKKYTEGEK